MIRGHQLSGLRLRHLDRFGIAADRGAERQDPGEAEALFDSFHDLVTGLTPVEERPELGKLAAFSGVCDYPMRVKCATLAWHTLKSALQAAEERRLSDANGEVWTQRLRRPLSKRSRPSSIRRSRSTSTTWG